jgi:hypothetical protein
MRPAAAAPQTPGSAIRAHQREGIMAQLSSVFTRLSTHMQASSKDSAEKVGAQGQRLCYLVWFCNLSVALCFASYCVLSAAAPGHDSSDKVDA